MGKTKTTNPTATANTNNNTTEERRKVTIIRNIVRVTKGEKNRYYFELDGDSFEGHDNQGKEVFTNSFSKDINTFAKESGQKHDILNVGYALVSAMKGRELAPEFVSLCLTGCNITIERTLKLATDTREGMSAEDVYGKDTWVNHVIDIKPNYTPIASQLLMMYLQNKDMLSVATVEESKTPSIADMLANINAAPNAIPVI